MYSLEQIACRGQDKTVTNMKIFLAKFQNAKAAMTHLRVSHFETSEVSYVRFFGENLRLDNFVLKLTDLYHNICNIPVILKSGLLHIF